MARFLLFTALFGLLLGSAYGRLGLGLWESTDDQENVEAVLRAFYGDRVTNFWIPKTKVLIGFRYDDEIDHFFYNLHFLPSNVSATFVYRSNEVKSIIYGDRVLDYKIWADFGDSGMVRAWWRYRDSNKTITSDHEFREDGSLVITSKIDNLTSRLVMRPTLTTFAQGVWEATPEGTNLDKLATMFPCHPVPPPTEKFRIYIKRHGDHYVRIINSTVGNQEFEFKLNKAGSTKLASGKVIDYTFEFDPALDELRGEMKCDSTDVKLQYFFDERGVNAIYTMDNLTITRFFKRVLPNEIFGRFQYANKQVNGESFNTLLTGYRKDKKDMFNAMRIELMHDADKFVKLITTPDNKIIRIDFRLGETGTFTTHDNTTIHFVFTYRTKMGRHILRGDYWTTEQPFRYMAISWEWEEEMKTVEVTYAMRNVVAKRWFTRV